jgi:hypothetical protein
MSDKAEMKKLRKYLRNLTGSVGCFLGVMDRLAVEPSSPQRGQKIAALCNALEMANDQARYFGLGVDYRTDKKAHGVETKGRT